MKLPLYQVDAFTSELFAGNPAAIVPLQHWLPDTLMQAIAAENNLAETAFFVPEAFEGGGYSLRWFTPTAEVQLCGHATLASAWVLYNCLGCSTPKIQFATASGVLEVARHARGLAMTLPRYQVERCSPPPLAADALGVMAAEWLTGPNYLSVLDSETTVRALRPDMALLSQMPERGLIVTAPADDADTDFVSRFFAPNFGIPEDPVTGSAHCMLAPYWASRLNKTCLQARQVSARGGDLQCEVLEEQVRITGEAVLFLSGEIEVPDPA